MRQERRQQIGVYLILGGGGLALLAALLPVVIAAGRTSRTGVLSTYLLLGGVLLLAAALASLRSPQPVPSIVLCVIGLLLVTWAALGALVVPNLGRFFLGVSGVRFSRSELAGYAALGWTAVASLAVAIPGFWIFYRATRRSG